MPDNITLSQHSRPTLLIGLGGTGKQVLLNLRRVFYDRHGVFTLPHIGHLWIDTDTRSKGIDGEDLDFLLKEVDFEEKEKVGTKLERSDLANYYDHPDDYPHIFSWFDLNLKKHGEIKDGAGQIRSFGRLAFFHHYRAIRDKVRDQVDRITSVNAQNQAARERGMTVDLSTWDAWVIFSVAGGTGSGMFLDMVFALRELYPNLNVRGILVLPSIFSSDTSARIYGNSYAALVELEHYNYAKDVQQSDNTGSLHLFHPQWTRDLFDHPGEGMRGPVFDTCYILGNRPRSKGGGVDIDDKNAYCEMLAEYLYIEYGGDSDALATQWRGARSNFTNALTNIVSHGYDFDNDSFRETYSVNYSSFGLSKLFIPIDRIYTRCRHRLALDLIDHWTRTVEPPRTLDKLLVDKIMPRLELAGDGERRDIVMALDWGGERGEKLVAQVRKQTREKTNSLLRELARDDIGEQISDWYLKDMLGGKLDRSDASVERWGSIATTIHRNADVHWQKVRGAIDNEVRAQLDQQRARYLEMETKSRGGGSRMDEDIADRLGWLQDGGGDFTRRAIVKVAMEFVERRLIFELRAQVYSEAAGLLKRIIDHIGKGETVKDAQNKEVQVDTGLLKQLTSLQDSLRNDLRGRIEHRLDAFSKPVSSLINQNLYEDSDFSKVYTTEQDEPIGQSFLTECERRFYEEHASTGPGSLWEVRKVVADQGIDHLLKLLLDFTRSRTRYMESRSADVIRRMAERYEPGGTQYNASISRLLDFSQPWLAEPIHHIPPNLMSHCTQAGWIAREDASNQEYNRKFDEAVRRASGTRIAFAGSTRDRVYACSELAGFPLLSIPQLDCYRDNAYLPMMQKGEVLHTDLGYEKFQDLMPKAQEELRQHVRALKALIQAILVRVVDCERGAETTYGHHISYFYTTQATLFPQNIELGSFSLAVRRLAEKRNAKQLEEIERETGTRIDSFKETPRARFLALLFYFEGQHELSPNRKLPEDNATRAAVRQLATRILERNPTLKDEAFKQLENITDWSEERPTGSGIRVMRKMRGEHDA
jgi:hypothetical protein